MKETGTGTATEIETRTGIRTKADKVRTDHAQQESTSLEAPITEERVASETSGVVGNSCVFRSIVCKRCPLKTVAGTAVPCGCAPARKTAQYRSESGNPDRAIAVASVGNRMNYMHIENPAQAISGAVTSEPNPIVLILPDLCFFLWLPFPFLSLQPEILARTVTHVEAELL